MKKNISNSSSTHGLRGWVFLFVVTIVIVGGVVFWRQRVAAPSDSTPIVEDVLPEAPPDVVDVQNLGNGERLVVNEEAGYEVKVASDMYLYSDKLEENDLVIQDYKEPADGYGGLPGCRVIVDVSEGNLDNIETEVKTTCDNSQDCQSYTIKEVNDYDVDWYEIKYFGE